MGDLGTRRLVFATEGHELECSIAGTKSQVFEPSRGRPGILGCHHAWAWSMVVAGEADDRPVVAGAG